MATKDIKFGQVPVLIIDYNEMNSTVLNMQLKPTGLRPIFAPSAEKGLSILKLAKECDIPIPIVICDYQMASLNGLEFVKAIRRDPLIKNTQVILLTSENIGQAKQHFMDLDVHQFLPRPCSVDTLIKSIAKYVPPLETPVQVASSKEGIRILAADDDPVNLVVIKGFLNLAGYTVDTVKDGVEAVKAFQNINYDLILMDICMPIMDGVFATIQIREIESKQNKRPVPIVAVTAHFTPTQRTRYLEVGMNDVIAKPIRKVTIDNCLEKWCPRYPVANQANPQRLASG